MFQKCSNLSTHVCIHFFSQMYVHTLNAVSFQCAHSISSNLWLYQTMDNILQENHKHTQTLWKVTEWVSSHLWISFIDKSFWVWQYSCLQLNQIPSYANKNGYLIFFDDLFSDLLEFICIFEIVFVDKKDIIYNSNVSRVNQISYFIQSILIRT